MSKTTTSTTTTSKSSKETFEYNEDELYPPLDHSARYASDLDESVLKTLGMLPDEIAAFVKQRHMYINKDVILKDQVKTPDKSSFVDYKQLHIKSPVNNARAIELLKKLVIVKLNGGLGSSMGCKGAKSSIEVAPGVTFLDMAVAHIEQINQDYNVDVPLVLMNSFKTDTQTTKIIEKYKTHRVTIKTFVQSKFPRMYKDTLNVVPKPSNEANLKDWYPPGSGDVFRSLHRCGLLDEFIAQGKEYIFISNVENLGAVTDLHILNHMDNEKIEFGLEVTTRISTDTSGGVLMSYLDRLHLLELSQIKHDKLKMFKDFKFWNTNNIWVSLRSLSPLIKSDKLVLDWIVSFHNENHKALVQLETPAGMGIQNFSNSIAFLVPRGRYRPIKSTSQLLISQSNLFQFEHGKMSINPKRDSSDIPLVKLGEEFTSVSEYEKRFKSIPDLLELDHLTVSGDVYFGVNTKLKGTVIIVANHGERIEIPDGVTLENKIISGTLRIMDH
ncbi:hypothetical protein SAMD00019534_102250, partial [Acytostelium subglobosum LB1]|uniref:hypothetical protein n=1 Tax=Acytostelium subglobosum LB1 TaxID=1410327 RepID=UPI0006447F5F